LKLLLIFMLTGLICAAAQAGSDELKPLKDWLKRADNGDWLLDNGHYMLRFGKQYGYAGIELRILAGSGT